MSIFFNPFISNFDYVGSGGAATGIGSVISASEPNAVLFVTGTGTGVLAQDPLNFSYDPLTETLGIENVSVSGTLTLPSQLTSYVLAAPATGAGSPTFRQLDTDDVLEGTNLYFTDARAKTATIQNAVTSGVVDFAPTEDAVFQALLLKIDLTEKGANNGVATLDSGGKIPAAQLPSTVMEYKGNWNASTNTPTLADGVGDAGDVYRTNVAGTTDFGSGPIVFEVGDWAVYNGTIWEKSLNSNAVVSVNGQQGVVVLDTGDVSEDGNLYFTDERAQDAVGSILTDSGSVDFTYDDVGNQISAVVLASGVSHSGLANLSADDHTQYHNDSRALTWLGTRSTTDLPEGSNLYFTDEKAQDAVGGALVDSGSVNFTYNDAANTITAVVLTSGISHADLSGLSADDHPQYAILAGRAGGQVLEGGTTSGASLTLSSTHNATKGLIRFGVSQSAYDEVNTRLGIGTSSPDSDLHIVKPLGATAKLYTSSNTANASITMRRSRAGIANLQAADIMGALSYTAQVSAAETAIANIIGTYTGDGTTQSGSLSFQTSNAGAPAERASISSDGSFHLGTSTQYLQSSYQHAISISTGTNVVSALTFAHGTYRTAIMEYSIKETTSNNVRAGVLMVATDGTNVSITDSGTSTADISCAFSAAVNGANIEISADKTTNTASMNVLIKRFLA